MSTGITGIHVHMSVSSENYSYNEHVLFLQATSAILWKQRNGPIHLYTTEKDLEFFKSIGMDVFYDHIDTEVLKDETIPWKHFYPAAKMKVLSTITEFPVAFIDTDFMYKETLPEDPSNYDIIFMHREGVFWRNYPSVEYLGKRPDYQFPDFPELETTKPINVGFFIMSNPELAKKYTDLALDYMRGNDVYCKQVSWASSGLALFWKSLFVEQRLLGAVVDNGNYKTCQLFPLDYHGDTMCWKGEDRLYLQDEVKSFFKIPFFHLWGEKSMHGLEDGQSVRILSFYSLIENLRHIEIDEVQDFLYAVLEYTAEKTSEQENADVYQLSSFIKILANR
jgi:hypothetical protein